MLLSTHGLDRRVRDNLRGFLDGGGGVFIAAGPEVDPAVVSTLFDWQPVLAPREMRDAGVLAATDLRHPVFRPFDAVAANFGQVMFDRAWQVDPSSAWRVVARYTNGGTAVAERLSTAPGRVLLFTSDVDRKWNEFPLNPAFVPFSQEVARYLGAGRRPNRPTSSRMSRLAWRLVPVSSRPETGRWRSTSTPVRAPSSGSRRWSSRSS